MLWKDFRTGMSRRQVLKMLGVGSGILAVGGGLTGCVSWFYQQAGVPATKNTNNKATNLQAALNIDDDPPKLDSKLLDITRRKLKAALKKLNTLRQAGIHSIKTPLEVKDAFRHAVKAMDHLDQVGYVSWASNRWQQIVHAVRGFSPNQLPQRVLKELREAGFTFGEIAEIFRVNKNESQLLQLNVQEVFGKVKRGFEQVAASDSLIIQMATCNSCNPMMYDPGDGGGPSPPGGGGGIGFRWKCAPGFIVVVLSAQSNPFLAAISMGLLIDACSPK